jgi:ferredoxin
VSLFSAAERLAAIDRSTVIFDQSRCLHSPDKFSECKACFEICPVGAITTGKPPVLNTEQCQTCLACLPACPAGAYSADDAVPALLNCTGRLENSIMELVCEKHPAAEKGFQPEAVGLRVRGCLAGLGTGAYMILAALGIELVILRTEACGSCEWGALRSRIESQVAQAQRLLSPWDKAQTVKCLPVLENPVDRPLWQADNPPLSRRDLFRLAARQGQVAIARSIEKGHTNSERQPGRERLRMLGAMAHLPHIPEDPSSLAGMGFACLSVSEACTACGVCGHACPTGALCFEHSEDRSSYTLTFSARKCIGCEICVHVCAPQALSLNDEPAFAQVFDEEKVTLQAGDLVRCDRCRTPFAAHQGGNLCPLCEYRRKHPFGSNLPPGAKQITPIILKDKHS